MKKLISLLLIVILLLSFVSCNTTPEESKSSSQSTTTATKATKPPTPQKPLNARAEPMAAFEYYMSTGEVTNRVRSLYEGSDNIEYVLGYTSQLLPRELIVYVFYRNKTPKGVLVLDTSAGKIEEIESYDPNYSGVFQKLQVYYANTDDSFELYGVVYGGAISDDIVLAKNKTDQAIYAVYKSKPEYFKGTDRPVYSSADLTLAKQEFKKNKKENIASVPRYTWIDKELPYDESNGWYNYTGPSPTYYEYIVPCPIVSENEEIDGYLLHLMYYGHRLIGEELIGRKKDVTEGPDWRVYVWEKYGEHDGSTYKYEEFTDSLYLKAIEDFKTANPDTDIKGVSFDGENFHVIPVD